MPFEVVDCNLFLYVSFNYAEDIMDCADFYEWTDGDSGFYEYIDLYTTRMFCLDLASLWKSMPRVYNTQI